MNREPSHDTCLSKGNRVLKVFTEYLLSTLIDKKAETRDLVLVVTLSLHVYTHERMLIKPDCGQINIGE